MRAFLPVLGLGLGLLLPGSLPGQERRPTEPAARAAAAPREVTAATLADPQALAALQAPGAVVFADDFEGDGSLDRYFEVNGRADGRARRVEDPDRAHGGRFALQLTAPDRDGEASGANAFGWLGDQGHERVHFRRYLRFAADYDQGDLNHTGGGLAGVAGTGKWDGMGQAGKRPDGTDRFSSSFEPWRDWGRQPAPGYLFLYTYWVDMQRDRDGNWWGNMLGPAPERRVVPPRDEWVCLEQMIRVNTVPADGAPRRDGEFAAWIDGELYTHWTGMRWRTDARVLIKRFVLQVYVHRARRDNTVWYDDVVLSTGYVGTVEQGLARRR